MYYRSITVKTSDDKVEMFPPIKMTIYYLKTITIHPKPLILIFTSMVGFTDVGFKPKNVNLNRCKFEYQIFSHVLDV